MIESIKAQCRCDRCMAAFEVDITDGVGYIDDVVYGSVPSTALTEEGDTEMLCKSCTALEASAA